MSLTGRRVTLRGAVQVVDETCTIPSDCCTGTADPSFGGLICNEVGDLCTSRWTDLVEGEDPPPDLAEAMVVQLLRITLPPGVEVEHGICEELVEEDCCP